MKLLLLIGLVISCTTSIAQQTILIKAGKLFNSEKGTFEQNVQLLVSNGKIEKIGKNISAPADAKVLDCSNCTVTPGLIDMHTHILYKESKGDRSILEDGLNNTDADRSLRAVRVAENYLKGGFTTIRDLGNSGEYLDISFRNAVKAGHVKGPTIFASGPIISPFGGQTYDLPMQYQHLVDKEYRVVKDPDDARLAIKEHIKMGVDLIKICADNTPGNLLLSSEELKAIVETAHDYNLQVTAHATFDKSARRAVLAGVDGIEHGYDLSDSTLDLMKKRNVYLVPTDPSYSGAMTIFKLQKTDVDTNYVSSVINSFRKRLIRAYKKGVPIVLGSDFYFNISYNESEASRDCLLSYFQAGMPVNEVLKTATWNAAKALGRQNQIGVLKEGLPADISIFEGDLETGFSSAIHKVKWTIKKGSIVP